MTGEAFCCVVCGNKRGKNVSLFRFPKDAEFRKLWAEFCGVEVDDINSRHRLCEKHFNKEDKGRRCLRKDAIPCIQTELRNSQSNFSSYNPELKKKSIKKKCCLCRRNRGDDVSLFCFPKDFVLRKLWADFCQKDASSLFPSDRLCSGHFIKDNFCNNLSSVGSRKRLKQGAVPSIFLAPKERACKLPLRTKRRKCFICGYKTSEMSPLFRMPKETSVRLAWEKFCRASHISPRAALCSRHFTASDIMYDNRKYGGKIKLKKTAVPSRCANRRRTKIGQDQNWLADRIEETNGFAEDSRSPEFIGVTSDDMIVDHSPDSEFPENDSDDGEVEHSPDHFLENFSGNGEIKYSPKSDVQRNTSDDMATEHSPDFRFEGNTSDDELVENPLTSQFVEVVIDDSPRSEFNENTCDGTVKEDPLTSEFPENISNHMLASDVVNSVQTVPDLLPYTPPEIPFPRRRYIGDFQRYDMKNPRLAEQFFLAAKAEIAEKTRALKGERSKNRRLTSKIDSLINILGKLTCTKNISENLSKVDDSEMSE